MYEIKLKRLVNEIEGREVFADVSGDEPVPLVERLKQKLNMPVIATGRAVLTKLLETATFCGHDVNAEKDDFRLRQVLESLGLSLGNYVYLNLMHFDDVDKVELDFLSKYFDDFWYPSSDDLDIIDQDLRWYVCVDHHGFIQFADLNSMPAP